jgi:RES domain-containing protein
MIVYRIARCELSQDLSGQGSFLYGGRWNSKGVRVLYTSSTSSLAMLEIMAHGFKPGKDYCLVVLQIPEDKVRVMKESDLPGEWSQNPAPDKLKKIGDTFVSENKFLVMHLPSAVNREEFNVLINPMHPDFKKIKILRTEKLKIDERLSK